MGGRSSSCIRESLLSEVVTLSCEELVALCRNLIQISYSSHDALLQPVPKLFPSLGKHEATKRGCNAFQSV